VTPISSAQAETQTGDVSYGSSVARGGQVELAIFKSHSYEINVHAEGADQRTTHIGDGQDESFKTLHHFDATNSNQLYLYGVGLRVTTSLTTMVRRSPTHLIA
jgi:hypothetical protein